MGKPFPPANVMNQYDRPRPQMHEAMHKKPLVAQSHAAKRPFANYNVDIASNCCSTLIVARYIKKYFWYMEPSATRLSMHLMGLLRSAGSTITSPRSAGRYAALTSRPSSTFNLVQTNLDSTFRVLSCQTVRPLTQFTHHTLQFICFQ